MVWTASASQRNQSEQNVGRRAWRARCFDGFSLVAAILVSIFRRDATDSHRSDRRNRWTARRSLHQCDQTRHRNQGHGRSDPRARRNLGSHRQLDLCCATVHAHGGILLPLTMKTWHYDSACDVDQPFVDRLRRFPREPDMLVYGVRALIALVIRGWLRIYHRFGIIGHENLRTNRSLVIVANHSSHLDTLCLLAALPLRKLHRAFPAAAADYFFQSVPRILVAAVVTNALPFARRVRVRRSLSICSELLSNPENILIIFPEVTRSKTGETREFNS